jgi:dephospho-CoA kinase
MTTLAIIIVTGASGSGKTATVHALDARKLPGVRCHHFDAVGVPSIEEMYRDFGSPEQWQATTTEQWLGRLTHHPDDADVHVLEGQTRPSFVREAAERARIALARVVLLDCSAQVRHARLAEMRRQPELSNAKMDRWAAYLRGQADALNLPLIDTTHLEIDAAADALARYVDIVRAERDRVPKG